MSIETRRAREREEMREKILDAARDLFAASGHDAVTMRKVADKIEYTPTAIYSYFRDKDALLRALCDADSRALRLTLKRIAREPDPIDRLRKMGLAYVRFGLGHPNHYRLMFMNPPSWPEPGGAGEAEPSSYSFLKRAVSDAIEAGRFRAEFRDADLLAQVVWGGVHGVVSLHLTLANDPWVDWRPARATARIMIDALVRGLGPDP